MKIQSVPCFPVLFVLVLTFLMAIHVPTAFPGQASHNMPTHIDPSGKYLFFLHNYYVETKGPDGDCRYNDILDAFSDQGFVVISEVRAGKIIPCTYSEKIVQQVRTLLTSGVSPKNIIISGHSKGGVIALCAASQLENPDLKFVIMAGCEIPGIKKYKLYPDFTKLKGTIVSVYAVSDTVADSCKKSFSMASQDLSGTEIKLESDAGHRLFFAPDEVWLLPVTQWINTIE